MSAKKGQGRVYKPKYKDRQGVIQENSIYWIQYSVRGERHRESAKTTRLDEATALLAKRLGNKKRAIPQHKLDRVPFSELEDLIRRYYKRKKNRSTKRLEISLRHLRAYFGGWRIADIESDDLDSYIDHRQDEGAADATINRELAALRKAFSLAARAKKARDLPVFEMLEENNVRKGWWTEAERAAVLEHAQDDLKPIIQVAHITGWRKGELLSRRWSDIDMKEGWLRLDVGDAKDEDEGRDFPIIEPLREVLVAQLERRREVEERTGRVVTALFSRNSGQPIVDYKKEWNQARIDAGLWEWAEDEDGNPVYNKDGSRKRIYTRTMHDFRRTAYRSMRRAGVSKGDAMELVGHKTDSMAKRYQIKDAVPLQKAGEKYSAHLNGAKTRAKSEGAKAVSL